MGYNVGMKIIIDISEDDYKEVLKDAYSGTPFENRVFSAIQNGTVLPACEINDMQDYLYDAPTILEADDETKAK